MANFPDLVAEAVTFDLSRIKDDTQALRLALLAVLALTQDGGELPDDFREYLVCHFRPFLQYWKDHATPFTEDYKIHRVKDDEGAYRLVLLAAFVSSLTPH